MSAAEVLARLVAERRTIRRFRRDHPGRGRIERLVALAALAPSASNRQPWRFLLVDAPASIAALAADAEAAVARAAWTIPPALAGGFASYGDYFTRFRAAPVTVAVACREHAVLGHLVGDGAAADDRAAIADMEAVSPLVATGMAVQNLLLAAHADGLGASCLTGPLIARPALEARLGIAAPWRLACLVALGFADEEPAAPPRRDAAALLRWLDAAPATAENAQP